MNKVIALLAVICVTFLSSFAEDQRDSKNAIGWNSGLSYRYYLKDNIWLCAIVNANLQREMVRDTQNTLTYTNASSNTEKTISQDSIYNYTASIEFEVGKKLFGYSILDFNTYAFGGYSYQNNKSITFGSSGYSYSTPLNSVFCGIGIEPDIWVMKKLSLGSKFGLKYQYQYQTKNNINYNPNFNISDNGTTQFQSFTIFGSVSLSASLIAYIYF